MWELSPESQEGLQGMGITQRPEVIPGRKGFRSGTVWLPGWGDGGEGHKEKERHQGGGILVWAGRARVSQGLAQSSPCVGQFQHHSRILLEGKGLISSQGAFSSWAHYPGSFGITGRHRESSLWGTSSVPQEAIRKGTEAG